MLTVHCDDPLPPYVNPNDFLKAVVNCVYPDKILYTHLDFNDLSYPRVTYTSKELIINVGVTNTFDETLQDVAAIDGKVEFYLAEHPDIKATVLLTDANIVGEFINPTTQLLTLDPEETIWFKTTWRYKLDDGTQLFSKIKWFDGPPNGPGNFTRTHDPAPMKVKASVRLFKAVNAARSKEINVVLLFEGWIIAPP
jgi:hypothetical protein